MTDEQTNGLTDEQTESVESEPELLSEAFLQDVKDRMRSWLEENRDVIPDGYINKELHPDFESYILECTDELLQKTLLMPYANRETDNDALADSSEFRKNQTTLLQIR